jgi:hypothetical protein
MTTWYVSMEDGTDSNSSAGNGDSFATRRKRLTNITSASLAPGDEIRVMGSPDPTSLGINATWTNGPIGEGVAPTSSTNATPIVMTKAGHGLATGDTIIVNGHTTNTNANGVWDVTVSGDDFTLLNADGSNSVGNGVGGATGTFRKVTCANVKLASALTANIACQGNRGALTNWTASANVTTAIDSTDFKEGGECQKITIASGFTTGKAAYLATGALDLSGYEQISIWIKQSVGTLGAAGDVTLSLCSDTAGATPVDTFDVPYLGQTGAWCNFTVDKGSALGASIQSIAFNVVTDKGAQTFLIDSIIAVKDSASADALSQSSLIGKNNADGDFWAIQSINGTRVMMDGVASVTPTATTVNGYFGTTEAVATYKRDTIKTTCVAISSNVQTMNDSGTQGSRITVSGGWNRTDMSTQTLETYLDGQSGEGYAIGASLKSYLDFSKINFVRYNRGYSLSGSFNTFDVTNAVACGSGINNPSGESNTYTCANSLNCLYAINIDGNIGTYNLGSVYGAGYSITTAGVNVSGIGNVINITGDVYGCRTASYGIDLSTAKDTKVYASNIKNFLYGVNFSSGEGNTVYDTVFTDNATSSARMLGFKAEKNYLVRCTLGDTTEVTPVTADYFNSSLYIQAKDGDADSHLVERGTYTIQSQTTVRHTASGIAWQVSPKNTTYVIDENPAVLTVAKVACAASALVTVKLWMRRDNTGLTARLMCKGKQLLGVATDVSTDMTAAADTWEEVTITFTPTEKGVVEITAECFGGTTYSLYVDDFSVTQA